MKITALSQLTPDMAKSENFHTLLCPEAVVCNKLAKAIWGDSASIEIVGDHKSGKWVAYCWSDEHIMSQTREQRDVAKAITVLEDRLVAAGRKKLNSLQKLLAHLEDR